MKFHSAILLVACLLPTPPVFGGSGSGSHGGDNQLMANNAAWFPRTPDNKRQTVTYCYEMGENFSVWREERIKKAIEDAYFSWYRYIADSLHEGYHEQLLRKDWTLGPEEQHVLLSYEKTCTDQTDIKFYLGKETPEVTAEKSRFRNPAAFTHLVKRDPQTAWAKGYVWIHHGRTYEFVSANYFPDEFIEIKWLNWVAENGLELVIKHEMGHIMGVPHIPKTIMDPNFLERLTCEGARCPNILEIDHSNRGEGLVNDPSDRQILRQKQQSVVVYQEDLGTFVAIEDENQRGRTFRKLDAILSYTDEDVDWRGNILVKGELGDQEYTLTFEPEDNIFPLTRGAQTELGDSVLFCFPPMNDRFEFKCTSLKQVAFAREVKLKKLDGKYQHFIFKYNMDGKIEISRMDIKNPIRARFVWN